jgi:sugar phosphate isomerase/epimerase
VFTKPWPDLSIAELGDKVRALGFQGIELPVRPGYPVNPDNVWRELPHAAATLAERDVRILSVAGPTDADTVEACGEAGVPVIRTMAQIGPEGYLATEERLQREYEALLPLLDQHGVTIGVQNHCGRFINNAIGTRRLIERFEPRHVAMVWDAAHEALCGGEPDLALEVAGTHLCMVNLKNALWQRTNGPEAEWAQWRIHWTSGRHGLASWPRVVAELRQRGYSGVVCLTAEYSDHAAVERLIAEDLAYARELFEAS